MGGKPRTDFHLVEAKPRFFRCYRCSQIIPLAIGECGEGRCKCGWPYAVKTQGVK